MNLVKNSFTLIETLISITFLSVVISGFMYSSYHDEINQENFMLLNNLENSFDTKDYKNFADHHSILHHIYFHYEDSIQEKNLENSIIGQTKI